MPVGHAVTPTSTLRSAGAAATGAAVAGAVAGASEVASSTSATISAGVAAARRAPTNSGLMSERASFDSSVRCAWSAPSGAAMRKMRSAGPSDAPKSTAGAGLAITRVGSSTAVERQCGMAMPPGIPVSVFCSRAQASAKSASASVARPVATTRSARARMTPARSVPRSTSSTTSSGVMRDDIVSPDGSGNSVGSAQRVTLMVVGVDFTAMDVTMAVSGRVSAVAGMVLPGSAAAAAPCATACARRRSGDAPCWSATR